VRKISNPSLAGVVSKVGTLGAFMIDFEKWDIATYFSLKEVACLYLEVSPDAPHTRTFNEKIYLIINELREEVYKTAKLNGINTNTFGFYIEFGIVNYVPNHNSQPDENQTLVTRDWLSNFFLNRGEFPLFLFKNNRSYESLKKILTNKNAYLNFGKTKKWIDNHINQIEESYNLNEQTIEKPLHIRTENNYLRLILSLANGIENFNPKKPYEAAQLIIDETEIDISQETLAGYISKAYDLESKNRD
jgi:hypothetical protein